MSITLVELDPVAEWMDCPVRRGILAEAAALLDGLRLEFEGTFGRSLPADVEVLQELFGMEPGERARRTREWINHVRELHNQPTEMVQE